MNELFEALEGATVKIRRTDGRVHPALVSGVNIAGKSVTVEWVDVQSGETKGKEIDLESILELNSNLFAVPDVSTRLVAAPLDNSLIPKGNRLSRNTTKASIPELPTKGSYRSRAQNRPTNIPTSSFSHNHQPSTETVPVTPCTPIAAVPPRMAQSLQPQMPPPSAPLAMAMPTQHGNSTQIVQSKRRTNVGGNQQKEKEIKTNVVREVEKLKKNREERRLRQIEVAKEKEERMNIDPGNPNWEFLAMIREYQNSLDYRPLRDNDPVEDHQITVCVRKRPLNKKEIQRKEVDVVTVPSKNQIVVHEPKNKVDLTKYLENQLFRFDYAFDENCNNELVYKYSAKPLIQTIFEGGMATCFAYGQTGSGKTHTMGGDFHGKTQDCSRGIYAMAARDVFKLLRSPKYKALNLVVAASFFEIYSGKVFDLLAEKAKLRVLEDGKQQVQVVGLTETMVDSVDEVLKIIQHGNSARTSGQTSANSNSSRSHAVFQIILRNLTTQKEHGKFSLIDLAGNERGADTHSANRQTRMEGAEINKSLLALKECIRALGRKGAHLPFRVSKLTQVLRDSFIGDKSKTCMIAMISPGMSSCEHTLNTMRYADRVKELAANDPTEVQEDMTQDDDQYYTYYENGDHRNGANHMNDSDFAALRSLNAGEMSAEMCNFHEALNQLQGAEDDVVESHTTLCDKSTAWAQRFKKLLQRARVPDYDQDAYSRDLKELISEMRSDLTTFEPMVDHFRDLLNAEEKLSQQMKPRK